MTDRERWERNRISPQFDSPFVVYDHDGIWADIKDSKGRIVVANIATEKANDWVGYDRMARNEQLQMQRAIKAERGEQTWKAAYADASRVAELAEIRMNELRAALVWANKVIEPFAIAAGAYEREPDVYYVGHRNTVADLRAARAFRDRNDMLKQFEKIRNGGYFDR